MRKMYIMSFLILSLCLVVESDHYLSEFFPTIRGGINKEGRSAGLRKSADQSLPMIEWLPDGAFAPVQFEGERWVYIVYKNQKYAIPKKGFSLDYSNLYGLITVPTLQYQRYKAWISRHIHWFHLCLVFSIVLWLIVRRKQMRPKIEIYGPDHVESQKTTDVVGVSVTDNQKDGIKQKLIDELFESKTFLKALNAEYRGQIEAMEIAADKMREELERIKKDADILGIDLDSSILPALVKGRLFEVFAAKIWDADSRTTIQSWTPDKGIREGIYIKSNGEPDFLLELKTQFEPQLMAIECKYRSIYTAQDKKKKTIHWIKYYQYKRYEKYEECTGRKVYMLLGADGDPSSPDCLYLAPLSKLKERSLFDDREDFKNYYAAPEALEPFTITALTMMDTLFSYLDNRTYC
jgi:hypothetical protein